MPFPRMEGILVRRPCSWGEFMRPFISFLFLLSVALAFKYAVFLSPSLNHWNYLLSFHLRSSLSNCSYSSFSNLFSTILVRSVTSPCLRHWHFLFSFNYSKFFLLFPKADLLQLIKPTLQALTFSQTLWAAFPSASKSHCCLITSSHSSDFTHIASYFSIDSYYTRPMSQFSLLNSLQNQNNGNVVRTMRKETNNLCSRKQRNPFLCSTILSSLSLVVPVVILRLHHVYWYHMHPRSNNLQLSRASLKSWSCQFSLREAPFLFFAVSGYP